MVTRDDFIRRIGGIFSQEIYSALQLLWDSEKSRIEGDSPTRDYNVRNLLISVITTQAFRS